MKKIQLINLAVAGVFVMLFVIGVLCNTYIFPYGGAEANEYAMSGEAQAEEVQRGDDVYKKENTDNMRHNTESGYADSGTVQDEKTGLVAAHIIIPKVSGESAIELEDIYIDRKIRVTVNNSLYGAYSKDMIVYDNDVVKKIRIKDKRPDGQTEAVTTVITLKLDGVYEYKVHEENDQYIIDMLDIRSVYDKVIVIDAGHGGGDNGCGSRYSGHHEKDITLSVVQSLKERLDNTDIKVYYTRLTDDTVYLRPRVALANAVKADMFISIHCNYYERYWEGPVYGAEGLYSSKKKELKKNNKKLAGIMIDSFTRETSIKKRGIIDRKKELFILKKSRVPATIVEMAYMSDKKDLKHLTNSEQRKKVVDGLYNGIVDSYKAMYGKTVSDGS